MKNRNQKRAIFAAAAILALCAAGISGCIKQTETPIVAEKQSSQEPGPEAVADADEEPEGSIVSKSSGPDLGTWDLTNVPERYHVNIAEDHIRLEADAPIEVPNVTRIPVIEIENSPYTEDDCESILTLMKKETGVAEWIPNEYLTLDNGHEVPQNSWVAFGDPENPGKSEYFLLEEDDDTKSYTSADGAYNFTFGQGKNPNHTPMMWLTSLSYSDGGSDLNYVTDLSDFSISGKEREALKSELKARAETLLQNMSLSEFQLKTAQWRRISKTENNTTGFKGEYGLRLTYVRSFHGIKTVNRDIGWASSPMAPCQYVELLYLEDGTLLRMKNINRERVSADLGTEDFLLPFDAAAQIFEQYLKYYQTVYTFTDWSGYSGMTVSPATVPDQKPNLSITVTSVRFGYQLVYDGWDGKTLSKGAGKGRLVPVWAFYGTPKAGYWTEDSADSSSTSMLIPQASENGLLLTVNAVDGTVYGNE